jgi:hypothetical protein
MPTGVIPAAPLRSSAGATQAHAAAAKTASYISCPIVRRIVFPVNAQRRDHTTLSRQAQRGNPEV